MKQSFTVSAESAGERHDKFLASITGLSRSYIQTLITDASRKLKEGEVVEIEIPEAKPLDLIPWDFPLNIVYEDDEQIVLNKPAGLTVHPAPGNYDKTLVQALLHNCKGNLSGINGVERPGIVHRLDKDTSGLMVVAKTDAAHKRLAAGIETKEIKRRYLAIVNGVPMNTEGTIRTGFGRHPKDRKKMTTFDLTEEIYSTGGSSRSASYTKNGEIEVGSTTEFGMERGGGRSKVAVTEYEIFEVLAGGNASLIECRLQTGRTHQIRVHMKHIKHPIIGDPVYGVSRKNKYLPDFPRQALHAYQLDIPGVGEFQADLPDDMAQLLETLQKIGS